MKYIGKLFGNYNKLSLSSLRKKRESQGRGDTIVEVMISLVVLSMILATVYAMGARSLRVGTESNQRTEALSVAQSQIDLLINAKNLDPNFATNYQVAQPFCLKPDGTKDTSAQSNSNKLCNSYNGGQYNIGVNYNSNIFTITAQWPSTDAPNGVANLNLYYKLPGTYKKALVTAGSAVAVGTSATINGTVNPNGNTVTDCYFNYDTSLTYSQAKKVACSSSPGSGTTDVGVTANISGLDTNSTYYFQLCATNIVGTACSANNGTFTTPALPSITNQSATNYKTASGNTADLNAQVNPNGTAVTACYFEWGLTAAYGSSKNCGGVIGSGTDYVPVTVNIAPLIAGSTYHFHLVATNVAGTKAGPDATFVPIKVVPPVVTLSASPTIVSRGASSTLTWGSTGADSCTGNGFSTSGLLSGSASTGALNSPATYSVSCTNIGGTTTSSPVTVNIQPTASLSASPSSIGNGSSSTLSWSSTNATSCSGINFSTGGATSGSAGTGGLGGPATYNYSVSCSGAGGSASASASVSVAAPPPPPPPPPPPSCSSTAGGFRSGIRVWISGGGSGCGYWLDSIVGWNGTFSNWGPIFSGGQVCHTQRGGVDPWGWLSSAGWCG